MCILRQTGSEASNSPLVLFPRTRGSRLEPTCASGRTVPPKVSPRRPLRARTPSVPQEGEADFFKGLECSGRGLEPARFWRLPGGLRT